MSKLLRLREWLTVPEAASYLSGVLSEQVTEADLIRLALEMKLRLSVHFVNHTQAWVGHAIPLEQAERKDVHFPSNFLGDSPSDRIVSYLVDPQIDDERAIRLDKKVTSISGVWDLPMIGSERLDVEHLYQQLTDGPEVTLIDMAGTFVERESGEMCRLAARLNNGGDPKDYYPVGCLPSDSVLVIRMSALLEFQQGITQVSQSERPLALKAEDTYRHIIGSMLEIMLGKSPSGQKHSVYANQSALIDAIVVRYPKVQGLSKRTLEKRFAEAKRAIESI